MKRSVRLLLLLAHAALGCAAVAGYPDDPILVSPASGSCAFTAEDPRSCGACGVLCRAGQQCSAGACVCQPGLTECTGECIDLSTDPRNCGACGTRCNAGDACSDGKCKSGCSWLQTRCAVGSAYACLSLLGNGSRDPSHCGSCDKACGAGELCIKGDCRAFTPAPTCTKCPCDECGAALDGGSTCCGRPSGATHAICVAGSSCP